MEELRRLIRNVPDFPHKGIQFKDITTLVKDGKAFAKVIDLFDQRYRDKRVDIIVGVESRGFIFGGALAYKWGVGFVPVRKPGKLPAEKIREEYELEYGTDALEIHTDAIQPGQRVLIIDDLLATGGTLAATARLVERLGGTVVGIAFLIELAFLNGREKIKQYDCYSIVQYHAEEEK
jgi:adenine phosphoribosyltransferase